MTNKSKKLVEIARSFSYKLNCGNYSTADFFCSEKAEVSEDQAEKKSEELYDFCKQEVIKSVNSYLAEHRPKTPDQIKEKEKFQRKYNEASKADDIEREIAEVDNW
jgi:tryptophanyl-tRNA synthetase